MDNLKGSINLLGITGAEACKLNNKQGIFIPIDNPAIYVGKKTISLDVDLWELREEAYGNTHRLVSHVSNMDKRRELGDNVKNYEPVIGYLKPIGRSNKSNNDETSQGYQRPAPVRSIPQPVEPQQQIESDLPF